MVDPQLVLVDLTSMIEWADRFLDEGDYNLPTPNLVATSAVVLRVAMRLCSDPNVIDLMPEDLASDWIATIGNVAVAIVAHNVSWFAENWLARSFEQITFIVSLVLRNEAPERAAELLVALRAMVHS